VNDTSSYSFTINGFRRGAIKIAPVALFGAAFGAVFGIAAAETGISSLETALMSAFVFAGASQFAALEIWGAEMSLLALAALTLAVNARHVLMGASLSPWLKTAPWRIKCLVAASLTDANWALGLQQRHRGEADAAYLVGSGAAMISCWIAGTILGAFFGALVPTPHKFGLDMMMPVFFAALLTDMWKGKSSLIPWAVAGLVAILAREVLPDSWYIIAGAFAGGVIGVLVNGDQ